MPYLFILFHMIGACWRTAAILVSQSAGQENPCAATHTRIRTHILLQLLISTVRPAYFTRKCMPCWGGGGVAQLLLPLRLPVRFCRFRYCGNFRYRHETATDAVTDPACLMQRRLHGIGHYVRGFIGMKGADGEQGISGEVRVGARFKLHYSVGGSLMQTLTDSQH